MEGKILIFRGEAIGCWTSKFIFFPVGTKSIPAQISFCGCMYCLSSVLFGILKLAWFSPITYWVHFPILSQKKFLVV